MTTFTNNCCLSQRRRHGLGLSLIELTLAIALVSIVGIFVYTHATQAWVANERNISTILTSTTATNLQESLLATTTPMAALDSLVPGSSGTWKPLPADSPIFAGGPTRIEVIATTTFDSNGSMAIIVRDNFGNTVIIASGAASASQPVADPSGGGGVAPITNIATFTRTVIAAGQKHTLYLRRTDAALYATGDNSAGQLGIGASPRSAVLVRVNGLPGSPAAVGAGLAFSLIVQTDGTVWTWGNNERGQLGDGTTVSPRTAPIQMKGVGAVASLSNIVAVSAGASFAVALEASGSVVAWGDGRLGQLGNNAAPATPQTIPIRCVGPGNVGVASQVVAIACGWRHVVALLANGRVMTWGANEAGQIGDGTGGTTGAFTSIPVVITSIPASVTAIAAGGAHSLAVTAAGNVYAWGDNNWGQLGIGNSSVQRKNPVVVRSEAGGGDLTGIVGVAAGASHSLTLGNAGTCWSFGTDANGALGDGSATTDQNRPVPVRNVGGSSALSGVASITCGAYHSIASLTTNAIVGWGRDFDSQLGDNVSPGTTLRTVPVNAVIP